MFIDIAMTRKLESVEEMGGAGFAETLGKRRPEIGCVVEKIAGGHAAFAGVGSPVSHILGAGLGGEVTKDEFDRIEDFYFSRGSGVEVVAAPLADRSLMQHLRERGYTHSEWNSVLFQPLSEVPRAPDPPAALEIRAVRPEELDAWAHLLARCFAEDAEGIAMLADLFQTTASVPDAFALIALWEGKPAGGAGGMVVRQHNVAGLYGAGTLPEFRNRGIQTALLHHRMRLAQGAGCEMAVVIAVPGTISERNAIRCGFRLAYTKAAFQRPRPA